MTNRASVRVSAISVVLALLCLATLEAAPFINGVTFVQESDGSGGTRVRVGYNLFSAGNPATVQLRYSTDGGASFPFSAVTVSGDAGPGIVHGPNKEIMWNVGADLPSQALSSVVVMVLAEDGIPIPLVISSSMANGTSTMTTTHTLSFEFEQPVNGFESDDIAVLNATVGSFAAVSDTLFTLEIEVTGSPVTVAVPEGAATAAVGTGNISAAADFGFLYNSPASSELTFVLPGGVPLEMVRIPPGTFMMGSPLGQLSRNGDEDEFEVQISIGFLAGKYEITQEQWIAVYIALPEPPYPNYGIGDEYPAYRITWNNAKAFVDQLSFYLNESGQGPVIADLPTEAQWEYACRGGTTSRFYFGDGFGADEMCSAEPDRTANMWYCGLNGEPGPVDYGTRHVGLKLPNPFGLYDMHGNVEEWCLDRYGLYPTSPTIDPAGPATGHHRVRRGGKWDSRASECRAAARTYGDPAGPTTSVGLRVICIE